MRTPDQSHHLHFSLREFPQVFNDFASVSNTGQVTSTQSTVLGGFFTTASRTSLTIQAVTKRLAKRSGQQLQ